MGANTTQSRMPLREVLVRGAAVADRFAIVGVEHGDVELDVAVGEVRVGVGHLLERGHLVFAVLHAVLDQAVEHRRQVVDASVRPSGVAVGQREHVGEVHAEIVCRPPA